MNFKHHKFEDESQSNYPSYPLYSHKDSRALDIESKGAESNINAKYASNPPVIIPQTTESSTRQDRSKWIVLFNIIVTFSLGASCLIYHYEELKPHTLIVGYILAVMFLHMIAFLLGLVALVVIMGMAKVFTRRDFRNLIGYFPVLFTLFVNCEYAASILLGAEILKLNYETLEPLVRAFIIFQMSAAAVVIALAVHSFFFKPSAPSVYGSHIESDLYAVNESFRLKREEATKSSNDSLNNISLPTRTNTTRVEETQPRTRGREEFTKSVVNNSLSLGNPNPEASNRSLAQSQRSDDAVMMHLLQNIQMSRYN